jgi:hypothetical protein
MKLRHAAALALVGWYLMLPPRRSGSLNSFDANAPLSQWSVYRSYDSDGDCELSLVNTAGGMLEDPPADFVYRFDNNFMAVFKQAICIASDDPLLKGNQATRDFKFRHSMPN